MLKICKNHPCKCGKNIDEYGWHPQCTALNDFIIPFIKISWVASFSQGKTLCWDAKCVNTFGESTANDSAMEVGQAAVKAETTKRTSQKIQI